MIKRRYIIVISTVIVLVIMGVSWFGRLIEQKTVSYVKEEIMKVSKVLIRDILTDDFFQSYSVKEMFNVERDSSGKIELVNFDTFKVNALLGEVNERVFNYFIDLERGNNSLLFESSSFFSTYSVGSSKGLLIEVPLGIVFSNPIVMGFGPKIPIKMVLSGQVESDIATSIKQYGINNVLLQIEVVVKVKELILFPFTTQEIEVSLNIPIIIELINGEVPSNLFSR